MYVSEPCENVTVSFLSPVCASFHVQCFLALASTKRTAVFEKAIFTLPAFLMT